MLSKVFDFVIKIFSSVDVIRSKVWFCHQFFMINFCVLLFIQNLRIWILLSKFCLNFIQISSSIFNFSRSSSSFCICSWLSYRNWFHCISYDSLSYLSITISQSVPYLSYLHLKHQLMTINICVLLFIQYFRIFDLVIQILFTLHTNID